MAEAWLQDAWNAQGTWSQVAGRLKGRVERWRRITLGLQIAGAIVASLGATVGLDTAAGKWHSAAVRRRVSELETDVGGLEHHTEPLSATRTLPAVKDVATYKQVRVVGQIDGYYRREGGKHRRRTRLFRSLEIGLAVCGAVLIDGLAIWVPVVTTIAAAITAHAAAQRHEYLTVEYFRTAAALKRAVREQQDGSLSDADFVAECERVISAQNADWMAKLDEAEKT
jgi:hypothetical protein